METVKLPKMQDLEVEDLINEQFLCRVAFRGTTYPYIAPFQYAVVNRTIYLHFTEYGKKMNFLEQGTLFPWKSKDTPQISVSMLL